MGVLLLELLVPDRIAVHVPPEDLHPVGPLAAKHEQMTRQRIELEYLLDQRRQGIEALAHVGRLGGKKHFDLAADAQHDRCSNSSRTVGNAAVSCAGTRMSNPLGRTTST